MGTHVAVNFLVGLLIVALLVLGWSALQGIGAAVDHGVHEWLVR